MRRSASIIPFGQPILVGHHSEKRDRAYRQWIENSFRKSFEAMGKADHYETKAATIGTAGISQDDPAATDKIDSRVIELRAFQDQVKVDNAKLRKAKFSPDDQSMLAKLQALGISEWSIGELRTLAAVCRYQVEPYSLAR